MLLFSFLGGGEVGAREDWIKEYLGVTSCGLFAICLVFKESRCLFSLF